MKDWLVKKGIKTNEVDAAMKDSGITNLLYGWRSLGKVYDRLYQDWLDRMIRQEDRWSKFIKSKQEELM